ncbi:threonine/serine exporter family protein [Lapidilactobacillus luobeiensis]|uniref:threonine/serine exporter family protein n=1 Tax=Lapidilactobacillus luobeiensis TaxID=2950371 RepID=UPI0021C2D569|nr:threonine/serine exporter family protein [Lapidilactobacillus luobeiensis]
MPLWLIFLIQAAFSYLGTAAFAICVNNPRRALNACGLCGMIGWLAYWTVFQLGAGRMIANVTGSLVLGIMSLVFARRKKMPAILFNIPGIVPLVPGVTAYQAVYEMVLGSVDQAIVYTFRVAMVAGAIAIGFMLTSLFSEIWSRLRHRRAQQQALTKTPPKDQ